MPNCFEPEASRLELFPQDSFKVCDENQAIDMTDGRRVTHLCELQHLLVTLLSTAKSVVDLCYSSKVSEPPGNCSQGRHEHQ